MDDQIGPQRERLLKIRRGERVIDREQGPVPLGQLGDGRDVQHAEKRVGRRLDPDQLRSRAHELCEPLGPEILGVMRDDARSGRKTRSSRR